MWKTTEGIRTLAGAEAANLRETIGELVDAIRAAKLDEELKMKPKGESAVDNEVAMAGEVELNSLSATTGISLFDQLMWQQQLAMLLEVATPLLDPSLSPPQPSALMDATVAAIYAQMQIGVEYEIEMQQSSNDAFDGDTIRRQGIVAALREWRADYSCPDPECVVTDEWELAIAALRDRVLADEDWNLNELVLDLSPDVVDKLKAFTGVARDYFVDVPPDPDFRPPSSVWADLLELIAGTRPNEAVFDV